MSHSLLDTRLGTIGEKAWQDGKAPITRFVTDDGVVIGLPFHHISKTYEDSKLRALLIWYPVGTVEIRGPAVGEFHRLLALGNVDLVRANGDGITTLVFYPAEDGPPDAEASLEDDEVPTGVTSNR
jgi:hypothetical protein